MPKKIEKTQSEDHGRLLLTWHFPEYVKYQRGPYWYVIVIILLVGAIIYSVLTANFLFVLFLILFGLIIVLHQKRRPIKVDSSIFEDGIAVGQRFYEWSDIKNFRLVYQPPGVKRLYIDLKSVLLPDFSVPLEEQNPLRVRELLKDYLKEDLTKEEETITDRLNRWLKI